MSRKTLEVLALRRELLQARSALYRLRIRRDLNAIADKFDWARAGAQLATSLPLRSGLFRLALQSLGHGRIARLVAFVARVILVAKVTNFVVRAMRASPPKPSA